MSDAAPTRDTLRHDLDEAASRATHELRRHRVRLALAVSAERYAPVLLAVPLVFALLQLVRWGAGGPPAHVPAFALAIGAVVIPLFLVISRATTAAQRSVDRRGALKALDEELDSEDRLVTADEFLALPASPFVDAALEDAEAVARAARSRALALPKPAVDRHRVLAYLGGAVVLCFVASYLSDRARAVLERDVHAADPGSGELVAAAPAEDVGDEEQPPVDDEVPEHAPREAPTARPGDAAEEQQAASRLPEQAKESEGRTSAGRSSNAQASSGSGQARGSPSKQSQTTKAAERKQLELEKDKKKKKPNAEEDPPKRTEEEESGATAGRGSSRGSNRNPVATDWVSKDQVTTPDDQEIEDDEDTEDEEEEQESRGGMQPHMRDRKPPVSRDLTIGFGNQKNPDANGRSGASEHKKSRGTASLVLGVPIPDRVKGQPNPGRTKITQERIEPQTEDADALVADARRPRETPVGHEAQPDLLPWMRQMVKSYFLTLRTDPLNEAETTEDDS